MFGNKLKELRSTFQLNQTALGGLLGLSQDAVSRIENDKRALTSLEMFKLSREFDIPIGFFFGDVNLDNFLRIHFRATEDLTEEDSQKIPLLKEIARKQYDIEDVLKIKHDRILRKYPVGELDYSKIRDIALSERRILGLDNQEAIKDLLGLLRSRGIKIVEAILQFKINGIFLTIDENRFLIAINADNSPAVRNFTLAHEYGHYLFDRDDVFNHVSIDIETSRSLDQGEKIANAFAAEFLMPEASFDGFALTQDAMALYMHNYRVSRNALVYRLANLRRIDFEQKQYYLDKRNFKPTEALKRLEKLGLKSEEVEFYKRVQNIKSMKPRDKKARKVLDPHKLVTDTYWTMVLRAYERGLIAYSKVAEYLFMDERDLGKIVKKKEVAYEC